MDSTIVLVMGVSGSGKTSVGAALAARLGYAILDADDLHPAANVQKMRAGEPAVVACSALKRGYRDHLRKGRLGFRLVYLRGDEGLIARRLKARPGHYWPASLLASQFEALEPPGADESPIVVDIDQPLEKIVETLMAKLRAG